MKKQTKKNINEELSFMSESSAAILQQAPKGGRIILWLTVLFLSTAVAWASIAELDEITRGSGQVIPSRHIQEIQNLEGGILAEILVKEGDIVEENQVLMRIDDTRFSSSYRGSHLEYLALKAKAARLRAEAENTELSLPEDVISGQLDLANQETALFKSRQDELSTTLSILKQQLEQTKQEIEELKASKDQIQQSYYLVAKELRLTRPLVKDGAISEVEVLRLQRQVNDLRGELEKTKSSILRAEAKNDEVKRKLEEAELSFRNQARIELNETLAGLSKLSESNEALQDRVSRTLVRSPVKGTVKQIITNTIGGIIQPGMNMIEIVPLEDTLLIEAKIRPADIAFLHPGQNAKVKFTAYDFAIHGGLEGKVVHISADTIVDEKEESFYLVRIQTNKNHLGNDNEPLPIIPGMMAQVDILTGKKSVLDYLLKPVLRAKEVALTER